MKLTNAMLRELRSIERDGNPSDPYEWTHAPSGLWFHAREKVLDALLKRGLIFSEQEKSGYSLTDTARAAIAKATGAQS